MKLVYCNVNKLNGKQINLEYCISNDYEIRYENFNLKIIKKDNDLSSDFFGENIRDVNLLVGKNGTGKSSISNIIGLNRSNKLLNYNLEENTWCLIYETKINDEIKFVIDTNRVVIKNITNYKEHNSLINSYRMWIAKYDFETNMLIYDEEYTSNQADPLNMIYVPTKDSKLHTNINAYDLINRQVIFTASNKDLYQFFKKYYRNYVSYLPMDELIYSISLSNFKSAESFNLDEIQLKITDSNIESFEINFWKQNINKLVIDCLAEDKKPIVDKVVQSLSMNIGSEVIVYLKFVFKKLSEIYMQETFGHNENQNTYFEMAEKFITVVNKIPKKYFSQNAIVINPIKDNQLNEFQHAVETMDEINNDAMYNDGYNLLDSVIRIGPNNLSSGQIQLSELFAKIMSGINNLNNTNPILLVLDEPELYMHPEWERRLIYQLINLLKVKENEISILIATHSPFIVSDMPGSRIAKIISENDNLRIAKENNGYGRNFYDILNDNFFLDFTIGEFAKEKIDNILQRINGIKGINEEKLNLEKEIDLIGDKNIKYQLKKLLNQKIRYNAD